MRLDSVLSITQYSKEQLQDKKFLKNQITKYEEKIKQSKEKTKDLKHVQDVYKGLLKGDPFYVDLYGKRKEHPVENPCRFCGRECYGLDLICYHCTKKLIRKDKGFYQITLNCTCGKTFYPKRLGMPYEMEERVKCNNCNSNIVLSRWDLKTQIRVENKKISIPEVTNIGEEGDV